MSEDNASYCNNIFSGIQLHKSVAEVQNFGDFCFIFVWLITQEEFMTFSHLEIFKYFTWSMNFHSYNSTVSYFVLFNDTVSR
jgi:hypothetical protein